MTHPLERRSLRMHGVANVRLGESKWTIWCYEPENMPAMIDLLIAKGTLSESDRPHCVHWSAVKGATDGFTQDDVCRVLDADEMLDKAGIGTIMGEIRAALIEDLKQGPETPGAPRREWFGDTGADNVEGLIESN